MFEIFGYALLGLGIIAGIILAIASTRPDTFETKRTLRIAAAPDQVFPLINNLQQMNTWNPFALRETSGTSDYSGPASGPGARHTFAGRKSGAGHIEILETHAP